MDKYICVGKNYLEHAKELGDAVPEKPVLFLKPPSAGIFAEKNGQTIEVVLPRDRGAVHPECEVVALLGKDLEISAVSLGLDLTLRDLQAQLKRAGHPWEISKAFAGSAIVGPWMKNVEKYYSNDFEFLVNGKLRQRGNVSEMRMSIQECTCYAAGMFKLLPGDILFSGTPAGVGPVVAGDRSELRWDDLKINVLWK